MELLIQRIKDEFETAKEQGESNRQVEYWLGRMALAEELLQVAEHLKTVRTEEYCVFCKREQACHTCFIKRSPHEGSRK